MPTSATGARKAGSREPDTPGRKAPLIRLRHLLPARGGHLSFPSSPRSRGEGGAQRRMRGNGRGDVRGCPHPPQTRGKRYHGNLRRRGEKRPLIRLRHLLPACGEKEKRYTPACGEKKNNPPACGANGKSMSFL